MAAARQALGGDARLKDVKTLQLGGTFRRVIDGNDTDGDFDVFVELPDKYLRSEKTGTPGQPSTETVEALVGGEVRDVVRGGGGGRGGRGGGNVDAGGDSDTGAGGGDAAPAGDDDVAAGGDAAGPAAEAGSGAGPGRGNAVADSETQRRTRQADVARLLLMWLMTSPTPMAWVGIAEAPDGKADVLETKLADGQPTRLFLDAVSHLPLMLQWQGMPMPAGGRRGGGRGQGRGGAPGGAVQRQGDAPAPITFDFKFSDHRAVNGIKLPYVIAKAINGQTVERWSIRNYRINPSFNAATFTR
jgi:hypothetical protein